MIRERYEYLCVMITGDDLAKGLQVWGDGGWQVVAVLEQTEQGTGFLVSRRTMEMVDNAKRADAPRIVTLDGRNRVRGR